MQVRDSLEDNFLSASKRPSVSLYFGTHLKEELTDYYFVLKVTKVSPIPTQAE